MTIWTVPAKVVRVVDGDTVSLDLDLGWRIRLTTNCRLAFMNAPERGTEAGAIASLALLNKLPEGRDVWFVSHSLDKYGRPLGVVYLDNRGIVSWDLVDSVNLWMVKEGYAARLDASGKPVP